MGWQHRSVSASTAEQSLNNSCSLYRGSLSFSLPHHARPQMVHVKGDTVIRAAGSVELRNVHFIVYPGLHLLVNSGQAIKLSREQVISGSLSLFYLKPFSFDHVPCDSSEDET